MSSKKDVFISDIKVFASVALALVLASIFYYLEVYGAVLAAVYGIGVVELLNQTSTGRKIKAFTRKGRDR